MLPNDKKTSKIFIRTTNKRTMNIIALIQCTISLIIAASQYQESIGFCSGANKILEDSDVQEVAGDSKETCLRECLLVAGAKGCDYNTANGCFVVMIEVSGGDGTVGATCWKLPDTGESQCGQKQDLS